MSLLKEEIKLSGLHFPDYKNSNLKLVTDMANKRGIFSKKNRVIFLLIDALGFDLLNKVISSDKEIYKMLDGAEIKKISSLFPSFTPSIISSLESGMSIAEHGIVSGKIPIKEKGSFINVFDIPWWPKESKDGDVISHLFPQPKNLYKTAKNYKKFCYITPEYVLKKNSNSGAAGKIRNLPFISLQDMTIQIKKLIKNNFDFIYAYTDIIDHAQHVYANSYETLELTRLALRDLSGMIEVAKKQGYLIVITADHGQVSLSTKNTLWIKPNSGMMKFLSMPPWGSRAVFMNVMPSMSDRFERFFEEKYRKNFILLDSEKAIKDGLFGKTIVSDSIRNRFGTHIMIPKHSNGAAFFSFSNTKSRKRLLGNHGGLNKEEMEIPLIMI